MGTMSLVRPSPTRPESEPAPRYVTIKTILLRTGVHRQTVHYYLRKQLLPAPVRTSRTSALYSSSTIELIQLIQTLQKQQRLSLDEIVTLFRQNNYDVRAVRQSAAQSSFSPLHALLGEPVPALMTIAEVIEQMPQAPPRDWIQQLIDAGIVRATMQDGRAMLSAESAEALKAVWEGVQSGAPLDQFKQLSVSIEKQAQKEFDQFLEKIHSLATAKEAGVQVAKIFTSLEHFGALRRRSALHTLFMQRLRQPGHMFLGPNQTYVFPSRTFLQKMGLFRILDLLLRQLDRTPNDLNSLRDLARASYISSDWTRLHWAAQEILRLTPQDVSAVAMYGQALHYTGRTAESVTFLEDAITRAVNPMAKIRLGQALGALAYRSGDASRLLDAIIRRTRLANEAIKESVKNPGLQRKVRLNALLDTIYFSDPLGLNRPVEKEAQALYDEFAALPDRSLTPLAKISLAMSKMYSTYALYLVRHQQNHPKANQLLKEITKLDPDCVLAGRAGSDAATRK